MNTKEVSNTQITHDELLTVSPTLARYQQSILKEELWQRPELSLRDRSLVTVAALIARAQTLEMEDYLSSALDHGVEARELSEIITHLAFYSGWGNAMFAVQAASRVFQQRGIPQAQLPTAQDSLIPLDLQKELDRETYVQQLFGSVAPGLIQNTTDLLFRSLWLRPALLPRDRSLITVSALIASEQTAQVPYHLNRAMDHGLSASQAGEILTHLAFYSGWPNAFSALPVVKDVLLNRA